MNQSRTEANNVADRSGDAASYAHVSTEDQGKGFSIPTQIKSRLRTSIRGESHEGEYAQAL